jgi:phosphohistidine swiveling domain-containing protein
VPAVTAPIVGENGLLDDTAVVAKASIDVPNVAHVDTNTAAVIDDGKIVAATDTQPTWPTW